MNVSLRFTSRRTVVLFSAAILCGAAVLPVHSSPSDSENVVAGAKLFAESGCTQCHGPAGLGTAKGPSLRDVRKRRKSDEVRKQIHDGGANMPPFSDALTDEQIGSLVEFLQAKNAWKLVPAPSAP